MNAIGIPPSIGLICYGVLGLGASAAALATPGLGQTLLQAVYEQGQVSTSEWGSSSGLSVAVEARSLRDGVGLRLGYRTVSEPGEDVSRVCGFASCAAGPFAQSYTVKALGLGLVVDVGRHSSVAVALALNISIFEQAGALEHRVTDDGSTTSQATDYGVGPGVTCRFPSVGLGFRPLLYVRFDRVMGGDCDADASCYGDRNMAGAVLGLSRSP